MSKSVEQIVSEAIDIGGKMEWSAESPEEVNDIAAARRGVINEIQALIDTAREEERGRWVKAMQDQAAHHDRLNKELKDRGLDWDSTRLYHQDSALALRRMVEQLK